MSGDQLLHHGVALHQAGRLDDAERVYRSIPPDHPAYPDALHYLGLISFQRGDPRSAADQIAQAIELVFGLQGAAPAEFHVNLGNALKRCGEDERAAAAYRVALVLRPDLGLAWFNLALLQRMQGDIPGAVDSLQRATQSTSPPVVAWVELGECLVMANREGDAIRCFERATSYPNPENASRIARALLELGRPEAVVRLLEPLAGKAADPEMLNLLGCAQSSVGMLERAERTLKRALALAPGDVPIQDNLASVFKDAGRNDEAVDIYRRLTEDGKPAPAVWSNYLFSLLYSDKVLPDAVLAEHRRSASAFAPQGSCAPGGADFPSANGRIKVGYLSADFRNHPVAFFMEGILRHHDPEAVEVYLYYNGAVQDAWTARLKSLVPQWRSVRCLSDDALEQTIRDDRIDVLVDLSGHTAENRLAALACHPARVQANYLGYAFSTGMPWIDWRLVDSVTDPPGAERFASERLWRLPGSYYAYTPPVDVEEVGTLPALANGHLTFGVSANLAKVSSAALDLWAAALRRVAGSRLIWKARAFADSGVRRAMTAALHGRGIDRRRVRLDGWTAQGERWGFYREIDVALDTYPYNQATSTCEALWMGVPTVSFTGAAHPSRMGDSVLCAAGLESWAFPAERFTADDAEVGERFATLCASDALAELRSTLRDRLRGSQLLDCRRLTGGLEAAYREMLAGR